MLLGLPLSADVRNNQDIVAERTLFIGAGIGGGLHSRYRKESMDYFYRFSIPNLKLGYFLQNNLALILYVPSGLYRDGGKQRAFEAFMPTIQYWFGDRMYGSGGIGLAVDTTPFYNVDYTKGAPEFKRGVGVSLSFGYKFYRLSGKTNLDLQSRIFYGYLESMDENEGHNVTLELLLGINYY